MVSWAIISNTNGVELTNFFLRDAIFKGNDNTKGTDEYSRVGTLVPLMVVFKTVSKRLPLLTNKLQVINSGKRYPLKDYLEGYH